LATGFSTVDSFGLSQPSRQIATANVTESCAFIFDSSATFDHRLASFGDARPKVKLYEF
jgi:hypothetical protein